MNVDGSMPGEAAVARIKSDLAAYEADRRSAQRKIWLRVPLAVGALVVAVVLLALAFNAFADPNERWLSAPHVFLYVLGLVALAFVSRQAVKPAAEFRRSSRERLMSIIFGFIEDLRCGHEITPGSFDRLPRVATGDFSRESFDDVVTGKYQGSPFELYEAVLSNRAGTPDQTVFRGVILAMGAETAFPGLLVATRRSKAVQSFFRDMFGSSALEELTSGVPELDDIYEFRTDNAAAARPLVAGRLAQALQWLGEAWPDEPARVALHGGDAFLLIPHAKNFFELARGSSPIDYDRDVQPIVADMVSLLATGALVRKIASGG